MIITCPACATRYDLPDDAIPAAGRTVRCANCRNSWFQAADDNGPAASSPAIDPAAAASAGQPGGARPAVTMAPPAATPPVFDRLPLVAPAAVGGVGAVPAVDPDPDAYPADAAGGPSSFAYEAPFVPRRRRWQTWLLAIVALLLLLAAAGAAIIWYGAPEWLPFAHAKFAKARPGLVLDFPRDRVERRTLADGTEFFGARGTITNTAASRQSVPPLLIVLRDRRRREVYRWEVVPPKRDLGPGETMTINEAVTDIPRTATEPEIGWKTV